MNVRTRWEDGYNRLAGWEGKGPKEGELTCQPSERKTPSRLQSFGHSCPPSRSLTCGAHPKGLSAMTKAKLRALGIGLLLAFSMLSPLQASENPSHAYAVLVGVSNYSDPQIKPRAHAEE